MVNVFQGRKLAVILGVLTILSISSFPTVISAQGTPTIQLCMILDGSGSISSSDWNTIVNGVADAIENNLPHDGSVELTVVQFGYDSPTYAQTEIPPTVITAANYATVANDVRGISQAGDMTPMAHGIYLGWKEIKDSSYFATAERQVINLATDGVPNVRNYNATSDLDGSGGGPDAYDDVIAAKNIAVSQGLDELDMEGIGISNNDRDWFVSWVLHPQPGHVAPPFIPGWIRVVADADEFAATVGEKFEVIVEGEEVVGGIITSNPLITATWVVLTILAITAGLTASYILRKKIP